MSSLKDIVNMVIASNVILASCLLLTRLAAGVRLRGRELK
jgi:hypothetical protein